MARVDVSEFDSTAPVGTGAPRVCWALDFVIKHNNNWFNLHLSLQWQALHSGTNSLSRRLPFATFTTALSRSSGKCQCSLWLTAFVLHTCLPATIAHCERCSHLGKLIDWNNFDCRLITTIARLQPKTVQWNVVQASKSSFISYLSLIPKCPCAAWLSLRLSGHFLHEIHFC